MPKKPSNHGQPWTPQANKELEKLAAQNTPTRIIAMKMGRTKGSIESHASEIDLSLKPTNQSPYNRTKK